MVFIVSKGLVPKDATQVVAPVRTIVPREFINPCVQVIDDLQGKVEDTHLMDIDFMDNVQFPLMAIHAFMDYIVYRMEL
jgi:hypothetical protein